MHARWSILINVLNISAGTELCIRELIDDELIPLQDFVANVSELLILADQLFVSE